MTRGEYIFEGASQAPELQRLQLLEAVFDSKTQEWLSSARPLLGCRCLEVGAGAGSIAAWLASEVGESSDVIALDTNVRFLRELPRNVQLIEGRLGVVSLPAASFDVVHARYVLIHNADAELLVQAMLHVLKPGGLLVLEEPDFSAATTFTGPSKLRQAFQNVKRAVEETFAVRRMNHAFGAALPAVIARQGAQIRALEYDCPAASGGSQLATMMRMSAQFLGDKYIATGFVSATDIEDYAEFASTPTCWANYYATVRVLAEKPHGSGDHR